MFAFKLFYQKDVHHLYSKFRNSLNKAAIAAVAAGCLISAGAATAAAGPSYDIVVLGDSLAAGYELGFSEQSVPYGYAEHVYEQALFQGYRAGYRNYGVIGLKSEGLSKWLAAAAAGHQVTEADIQADLPDPRAAAIFGKTGQLEEDLRNAELVLISIGGNDFLHMVGKLGKETVFSQLPEAKQEELNHELTSLLDHYNNQLSFALETIQKLQPNAEVVVSNQYLPIPFLNVRGQITYLIPESTALFLVNGQTKLLERLTSVVDYYSRSGLNIKIADAASAIEKNILSYTTVEKGDIHPTESGYAELGKAFTEQLWGEYQTVKKRPSNVPVSIVVDGKELITNYVPVIKKNRTFLSLRDVTDALGADLKWNAATSTATITLEDRTVDITVGAKTIRINGKNVPLNAEPAFLKQFAGEKKTYVPLAALSFGLGFQVEYRDTLKTAFINR